MAKRSTTTRDTLLCTAVLLVCVSLPWACEFDTTPKILPHPPVADDDAGEER